jgi:hypothetical protein
VTSRSSKSELHQKQALNPRALAGVIAGGTVGALGFGGFIVLGLILDDRVSSLAPVIVLGLAGAYGGWLVGVVVFGAVRGGSDETEAPGETTRGVR